MSTSTGTNGHRVTCSRKPSWYRSKSDTSFWIISRESFPLCVYNFSLIQRNLDPFSLSCNWFSNPFDLPGDNFTFRLRCNWGRSWDFVLFVFSTPFLCFMERKHKWIPYISFLLRWEHGCITVLYRSRKPYNNSESRTPRRAQYWFLILI